MCVFLTFIMRVVYACRLYYVCSFLTSELFIFDFLVSCVLFTFVFYFVCSLFLKYVCFTLISSDMSSDIYLLLHVPIINKVPSLNSINIVSFVLHFHTCVRMSLVIEGTPVRQFKNICVFCGSTIGKNVEFVNAANHLGMVLAERKIKLIYGGGSLGLMGCVSTAAYIGGSQVLGIIPSALVGRNISGGTVGEEFQVSSMHERIARMLTNADAFIALPGGFGTLEEIFQIVSWAHLNIHQKPIGLLNVNNFFDSLFIFLDQAVEQGFISSSARKILVSASTAEELIDKLQTYVHEPDPATARINWTVESRKKQKLDLTLRL